MQYKSRFYVFFFLIIFSTSCTENKEEFIPDETFGDVQSLIKSVKQKPESLTFNTNNDFLFTSKDNQVIIQIPNGCLTKLDGSQVEGNVTFEYRSLHRAGDMILNQVSSISTKGILNASKIIQLILTSNGENLVLKENSKIAIYFKTPEELNNGSIFNWVHDEWANLLQSEIPSTSLNFGQWTISSNSGTIFATGYKAEVSKLGWFAIGSESNIYGDLSVCATLPAGFNAENTGTFILQQQKLFVLEMGFDLETSFCEKNIALTPNTNYKIVSLSDKGLNIYLGINDVTLGSTTHAISPNQLTKQQFVEFITTY